MGDPRRTYQQRVGSLLSAIDERHGHQLVLAAHGVTPMGMQDLEQEIQALRDELAAVIAAGSDAFVPNEASQELSKGRIAARRRTGLDSRPVRLMPAAPGRFAAQS